MGHKLRDERRAEHQQKPGAHRDAPQPERNRSVPGEREPHSDDGGGGNECEGLEARASLRASPRRPRQDSCRGGPAGARDRKENVRQKREILDEGRNRDDAGGHHERKRARVHRPYALALHSGGLVGGKRHTLS